MLENMDADGLAIAISAIILMVGTILRAQQMIGKERMKSARLETKIAAQGLEIDILKGAWDWADEIDEGYEDEWDEDDL